MDTDISHTTTGFKSFLLKPLAPFFKKKNAGAVVPIAVTGTPGHYQVSQDINPQQIAAHATESKGLVQRNPPATNRRSSNLHLTKLEISTGEDAPNVANRSLPAWRRSERGPRCISRRAGAGDRFSSNFVDRSSHNFVDRRSHSDAETGAFHPNRGTESRTRRRRDLATGVGRHN